MRKFLTILVLLLSVAFPARAQSVWSSNDGQTQYVTIEFDAVDLSNPVLREKHRPSLNYLSQVLRAQKNGLSTGQTMIWIESYVSVAGYSADQNRQLARSLSNIVKGYAVYNDGVLEDYFTTRNYSGSFNGSTAVTVVVVGSRYPTEALTSKQKIDYSQSSNVVPSDHVEQNDMDRAIKAMGIDATTILTPTNKSYDQSKLIQPRKDVPNVDWGDAPEAAASTGFIQAPDDFPAMNAPKRATQPTNDGRSSSIENARGQGHYEVLQASPQQAVLPSTPIGTTQYGNAQPVNQQTGSGVVYVDRSTGVPTTAPQYVNTQPTNQQSSGIVYVDRATGASTTIPVTPKQPASSADAFVGGSVAGAAVAGTIGALTPKPSSQQAQINNQTQQQAVAAKAEQLRVSEAAAQAKAAEIQAAKAEQLRIADVAAKAKIAEAEAVKAEQLRIAEANAKAKEEARLKIQFEKEAIEAAKIKAQEEEEAKREAERAAIRQAAEDKKAAERQKIIDRQERRAQMEEQDRTRVRVTAAQASVLSVDELKAMGVDEATIASMSAKKSNKSDGSTATSGKLQVGNKPAESSDKGERVSTPKTSDPSARIEQEKAIRELTRQRMAERQRNATLSKGRFAVAGVGFNALSTIALKPGLQFDAYFSDRFSVSLEYYFSKWNYTPENIFNISMLSLDLRYFIMSKKKEFDGLYVGLNGGFGEYDFRWGTSNGHQSQFWTVGLSVGYVLPIVKGSGFYMDAGISAGYVSENTQNYLNFSDHYLDQAIKTNGTVFAPTKIKLSFIYRIFNQKKSREKN